MPKRGDEENTEVASHGQNTAMIKREVFYSAPLPPASEFAKYEEALSGSADRIIKLAENQNSHRRFIEKIVIIFDSLKSLAGLVGGLTIVGAGMWAGVYLIMHDKSTGGFVALLAPLGVVASAFIFQQYKKDRSKEE